MLCYIFTMLKDLRVHGSLGPIDFFALVTGEDIHKTYFYEEEPSQIRFFSRGNEFTISAEGIRYRGTGGSFCEYMFGVEKPVKDLKKEDVLNRLIMFGAFLDNKEQVVFTNETGGTETFYRLFLQGHAVKNYYFMVSSEFDGDYRKRQKTILKSAGKFLKRTDLLADDRDTALLASFFSELNEKKSIFFVFKLINTANQEYYNAFRTFYLKNRELSAQQQLALDEIVARNNIDNYQQERMKIDIMYRHPENRIVVDEYRDILVQETTKDVFRASAHARLERLRTLSIRNNIPVALFDTLDELILKGRKVKVRDEQEYLKDARAILENLFFKDAALKQHIINEDIVRLIKAKHASYSNNDMGFQQILLDTGKACDEITLETNDFGVFEEFSAIVTFFDRYDNVHAVLSHLAFMKNIEFSEDSLRSLIGNKKEFDRLDNDLFQSLFIRDILRNQYITGYGKRKIKLIAKGIENIQSGEASFKDVMLSLNALSDEERLYYEIHAALKEKMRGFLPGLEMKEVRSRIRSDIARELSEKGIEVKIPQKLFEKVFIDLRKESVYLNQILPRIIRNSDDLLREDFLENSGLDRFYIEALEQEYFREKGLDTGLLESIREEKELPGFGGGERI